MYFTDRVRTNFRHHLAAISETESPKQMPKKGQDETFAIERKWGHRPKVILKICVHLRCFILYDCVEIETTDYSYLPTNFASN